MPEGAAHRHGGSSVRLLAHIWVGQEAESKAGLSYIPLAPPPSNPFCSTRIYPLKAPKSSQTGLQAGIECAST